MKMKMCTVTVVIKIIKKINILLSFLILILILSSNVFAVCVDSDDDMYTKGNDKFQYGKADLITNGQITETQSDICVKGKDDIDTMTWIDEKYCLGDSFIAFGSVPCPKGQVCVNGRCTISDRDFDKVIDSLESPSCIDTSPNSYVDQRKTIDNNINQFYGCSCEQGALEFTYYNPGNGLQGQMDCSLSKWFFEDLSCTSENLGNYIPNHCCNGKQDKGEVMADCGTNVGCKPCTSMCSKIVNSPGSSLDILLVPIKYTSNNQKKWIERAQAQGFKLSTTPPYCKSPTITEVLAGSTYTECEGKKINAAEDAYFGMITNSNGELFTPLVNVWRLDLHGNLFTKMTKSDGSVINVNFHEDVGRGRILDVNLAQSYKFVCPGIDQIGFISATSVTFDSVKDSGRAFAATNAQDNPYFVIYNVEFLGENTIVHELGHSFCNLKDEYTEKDKEGTDPFLGMQFVKEKYNPQIVNCDVAPTTDSTGNKVCKWQVPGSLYYIPSAGCIKGCLYSDEYYRPEFPLKNSMMKDNYDVGPGDKGISSWNYIGYARCKEYVDRYKI